MSMTLKKRWTRYRVKWFTKLQHGKTVPPGTEVEYEVWSGGGTPSAYLGSSGDIIHYRMPDDADCFKMASTHTRPHHPTPDAPGAAAPAQRLPE